MERLRETYSRSPRDVLHNQVHLYEAKSVPQRHPSKLGEIVQWLERCYSEVGKGAAAGEGDDVGLVVGRRLTETLVRS